uniref:FAM124 domain-containing protein n=1 Tax=Monopterus albus TaxID=43700 RepID=A0A3Q3Q3S4_MONAL
MSLIFRVYSPYPRTHPGDSLLLQHTLDRLLRWLCPSLRIFHVSERASPFSLCPMPGKCYPSLAITFFLHEAYGEERILKVLDFFQRPPWQYHHTENCSNRTGGIHITSNFYSLGAGMPVWGVRPVHCGGEILRVTLYSGYDNYEDAVRLYETVLQRQVEEQKTGFCWFTLHTEPGLCLQLALKQLSPGVRVEPCSCAVLQFSVEEIGQLVPLLPNPCTPISTTRWQTEDLDGNKVLFQVEEKVPGGGGRAEIFGAGSCCSTPPGSSCYSSQGSSPAPPSTSNHPDSPLRPSITRSLSHLLLEEDKEKLETNVDTGVLVSPRTDAAVDTMTRSSSSDLLMNLSSERHAAVDGPAKEMSKRLSQTHKHSLDSSTTWGSTGCTHAAKEDRGSWTMAAGQSLSKEPMVENRTSAEMLSAHTDKGEPIDEFFI